MPRRLADRRTPINTVGASIRRSAWRGQCRKGVLIVDQNRLAFIEYMRHPPLGLMSSGGAQSPLRYDSYFYTPTTFSIADRRCTIDACSEAGVPMASRQRARQENEELSGVLFQFNASSRGRGL